MEIKVSEPFDLWVGRVNYFGISSEVYFKTKEEAYSLAERLPLEDDKGRKLITYEVCKIENTGVLNTRAKYDIKVLIDNRPEEYRD